MPHLLVTGGAGFIGSHTLRRYLDQGWRATVYDNMSRVGSHLTIDWLRSHPNSENLTIIEADVRDYEGLRQPVAEADVILHAAGQTAVTTSVMEPRSDFEINALGTLNVLEAARESKTDTHNPFIIYTSTNKVYGEMEGVAIKLDGSRYQYVDYPQGIPEAQPLDFHSPYGCSKGTGDQYVRDYSRIYGLKTVVFRQSCIYGVWQFGREDQGWLAHFTIAGVLDSPLTIFGDGKQVRDVLYIDDLVNAFSAAIERKDTVSGQIFNIGGGADKAISLLELISMIEGFRGEKMSVSYDEWRPGDQRVFVSDISKAKSLLDWSPQVEVEAGVRRLYDWVQASPELLDEVRALHDG